MLASLKEWKGKEKFIEVIVERKRKNGIGHVVREESLERGDGGERGGGRGEGEERECWGNCCKVHMKR